MGNGKHLLDEALGLLDAVGFRADPVSLSTVLEGSHASRLLGCPGETLLTPGALWEGRIPEPDRERVLALLRSVAATGSPGIVEHRLLMEGRPLATFRTSVQRADEDGVPVLVGVMMDVTAARAEQTYSRELEAWLVTLGESLPFNFWICDRTERLVLQNPSSRSHHGEHLGESAATIVARRSLEPALAGTLVREEVEVADRIYSRVIAPVLLEAGGTVTGALGVDIDITELKRVEQELRASLTQLHATQNDLVRAKSLAALGEMAASVAHEVRNPLTAMFNVTELLRRGTPGPGGEQHLLGILFEELNRLDLLVSNIVEMVRPLEAQLTPQPVVSMLEDALADVLRRAAVTNAVRVARRFEDPRLEVIADGRLLGMALINVLRNALQAMPEGGELSLEVQSERRGSEAWVRIAIRDSGEGIPPEVRPKVFEPFFTTRASGSGMGLTIVKRVIEEHLGDIEVTSEPGAGTAVVMRLPASRLARP